MYFNNKYAYNDIKHESLFINTFLGLFNSRGPMEHLLNTHLLKTKVAGKNPAINSPQILVGAALSVSI